MTKMLLFSLPSRDPIYNVSTLAFVTLYLQQNTALVISVENPLYCISVSYTHLTLPTIYSV